MKVKIQIEDKLSKKILILNFNFYRFKYKTYHLFLEKKSNSVQNLDCRVLEKYGELSLLRKSESSKLFWHFFVTPERRLHF